MQKSYYAVISLAFSALSIISLLYIFIVRAISTEFYEVTIGWIVPLLVFPLIAIVIAIIARFYEKDKMSVAALLVPLCIYVSYFILILVLRYVG
ncbi:hypothetical protein A2215_01995 [Candidatus Berkelbacteria bacterium RIFOXYA2_FULL_43_10]|uniref:Uncharacterized protein n=1 Tax=Candidatus Berkelbacteria bacterium RIFOXYA2_FULL_43_10 TaxID=1797472 RepID=A0A1F5E3W8_9BACT|nr:MAG: hypothetical protein A2215_01995 [Candidatus Berkelbacteria bacterium RIFOXYA2_FULL_43_10]